MNRHWHANPNTEIEKQSDLRDVCWDLSSAIFDKNQQKRCRVSIDVTTTPTYQVRADEEEEEGEQTTLHYKKKRTEGYRSASPLECYSSEHPLPPIHFSKAVISPQLAAVAVAVE